MCVCCKVEWGRGGEEMQTERWALGERTARLDLHSSSQAVCVSLYAFAGASCPCRLGASMCRGVGVFLAQQAYFVAAYYLTQLVYFKSKLRKTLFQKSRDCNTFDQMLFLFYFSIYCSVFKKSCSSL